MSRIGWSVGTDVPAPDEACTLAGEGMAMLADVSMTQAKID